MLRITINKDQPVTRLSVEGRLAGEWVTELERCWRRDGHISTAAHPRRVARCTVRQRRRPQAAASDGASRSRIDCGRFDDEGHCRRDPCLNSKRQALIY